MKKTEKNYENKNFIRNMSPEEYRVYVQILMVEGKD